MRNLKNRKSIKEILLKSRFEGSIAENREKQHLVASINKSILGDFCSSLQQRSREI
jgi:hypothetical protein